MTATTEVSSGSDEADGAGDPPRPFEIPSYRNLLQFPVIPAASTPLVDAIIVPTFRSAAQVRTAVELASQARCQLLLLYTDDFPAELADVLGGLKHGEATALALRRDMRDDRLLDLGADLPLSFAAPAALDISRKRNLGLLIGRMCGWTRMLLLDDDIRRINIGKLSAAAALLDTHPVVGLQVIKFPDASVVGHARRLTGRMQVPFVSGGSLLINPQRLNGFFPAIYHEDWLCIIDHLRAGEVAIGGMVGQKSYQPFASPERARNEEFGDIFASGLLWLVHARSKANAPVPSDYWRETTSHSFWARILDERVALLEDVTARLKAQYPDNGSAHQSLDVARERCAELTPDEFVSVATRWMRNLEVWRERVAGLPPADSVEKALSELGLLGVVRPYQAATQVHAGPARRPWAKVLAVGSALGVAGVAAGVATSFWRRANKASLLRGRDRGSRLGRLVGGRGPGRRAERPLAGGDHAEEHDGAAAGGEQQPVGVTGRNEPGPQRTVQAGGQDRAGDRHAERLADLAARGGDP